MSDFRCPHCRTALPEKATFCAACGRRIEGWSAAPADTTPAVNPAASELVGDDAATRQVEPTPSLMRAMALSKRRERQASRWWIAVGMIVVALTGGTAAFFVVRLHKQAHQRPQTLVAQEPEPVDEPAPATPVNVPPVAAPQPLVPPAIAKAQPAKPPASKAPAMAKTIAPKPHQPKPARAIVASGPTHLAAPKLPRTAMPAGNGLPHKAVRTDSQSIAQLTAKQQKQAKLAQRDQATAPPNPALQMPTAAHETTMEASGAQDDREEARASLDADGVRFVVKAHLPQVRACYGRVFKDASPGGTVEVGFSIDGNGRAQNVRTERNSTDSEPLARCLETRVREWQFPRPVGGDFDLIYPFVFAPGS
ncbi:MAG TPA: AgmX/PglI C-terminal domain-containing protein [Polyangia bacterium]|nr:AgmX/PglI C-terminal domain-containing protein [Polyangia bacterium]